MQTLQTYQTRGLHRFFRTDLWHFELSIWLHVLGRTVVSIFIPIILLRAGFSVFQVIIFYLIYVGIDIPLNFIVSSLIRKIGARRVYILSTISILAFFILLGRIEVGQWFIFILIALLAAIYDASYWTSHLYFFEKVNHKVENISKNTGWLYAIKYLAAMLGPAIGGFMLIFTSTEALIFLSVVFFALSMFPIFHMKKTVDKPEEKEERLSFKEFFSNKEERINYISLMLFTIHRASELVIWPIFIYITFETIKSVALIPIIVSATSILFAYVAGKVTKKIGTKLVIIGSVLVGLIWLLRLYIGDPFFYYLSVFLIGFISLFVNVVIDGRIFSRGKKTAMLSAVTYRNACSMSAQFLLYIVLAFALGVLQVSFVMAAVSVFALAIFSTLILWIYKDKISVQAKRV